MKKEFRFLDKNYSLEMDDSNSSDGDFEKCDGRVYDGKLQYQGVFKLTKIAWEKASQKAQEKEKAAVDKTAKPLTAAEKLIAEKEEKQAKVAALLGELHGDAIAGEKLAAATLET